MFRTLIGTKAGPGLRLARVAALVVALLAMGCELQGRRPPEGLHQPGVEESRMVVQRLAVLERGWVPNDGQWDERAAFAAPGYFASTWVTQDGELRHVASKREDCEKQSRGASEPDVAIRRFQNPCPVQSWVLSERWVGGKVQVIRGEEELETKVSYFIGNDPARHRSGLPSYRYVSLGEVWPGVEVKLKASQKTVEKLLYVRPGANLAQVRIELEGAQSVQLSEQGELVIETGLGELLLSRPVAWQEKDGQKLPVQASYRLLGKNRYGFVVQAADPNLPLVIDPILQSTYLGGSGWDETLALAVHPLTGDVYVAGRTTSTDFPNTTGGAQPNYGGGRDAFVARLNSTLTSNPQSTYLGGTSDDWANALAIAPSGDVYVAGSTTSTNFPKTSGGAQENYGGGTFDAFVARLTADLAASFTLSISPTPTGGNVTSSPAGINCGSSGSTCSASFPSGITVTLMATPDTGYIFVGWGGDPDCADGSVTMNGDKTCTATFQLQMGLLWGDVDCDGDVDAVDALKVLRHVVRLAVSQEEPCPDIGSTVTVDGTPRLWGDVDGYGDVDAVDALQILRHVVRLWVAQRPGTPPIGSRVHVVLPG